MLTSLNVYIYHRYSLFSECVYLPKSVPPYSHLVSSWWAQLGYWSLDLKISRHGRDGGYRLGPWGCRGLKPGVPSVMVGTDSEPGDHVVGSHPWVAWVGISRLWTSCQEASESLTAKFMISCFVAPSSNAPWLVWAAVIQSSFALLSDAGESTLWLTSGTMGCKFAFLKERSVDVRSWEQGQKPSTIAHASHRERLCTPGEAPSWISSHWSSINGLKFSYFVCLCNFIRKKQA